MEKPRMENLDAKIKRNLIRLNIYLYNKSDDYIKKFENKYKVYKTRNFITDFIYGLAVGYYSVINKINNLEEKENEKNYIFN